MHAATGPFFLGRGTIKASVGGEKWEKKRLRVPETAEQTVPMGEVEKQSPLQENPFPNDQVKGGSHKVERWIGGLTICLLRNGTPKTKIRVIVGPQWDPRALRILKDEITKGGGEKI